MADESGRQFRVCLESAGSHDEALTIGRVLVQERLAAAANVVDGATSIHWWRGELRQRTEALLILKTRGDLVAQLTRRVVALHGYACPSVVALPVIEGHGDYLAWIDAETRPMPTK